MADALQLAQQLHAGQTDKSVKPYWQHPQRVAQAVESAGGIPAQVTAAYLHDTLEARGRLLRKYGAALVRLGTE